MHDLSIGLIRTRRSRPPLGPMVPTFMITWLHLRGVAGCRPKRTRDDGPPVPAYWPGPAYCRVVLRGVAGCQGRKSPEANLDCRCRPAPRSSTRVLDSWVDSDDGPQRHAAASAAIRVTGILSARRTKRKMPAEPPSQPPAAAAFAMYLESRHPLPRRLCPAGV